MKDFLAWVGLITICALIGMTPGLARLWLSGRKSRRAHRSTWIFTEVETPELAHTGAMTPKQIVGLRAMYPDSRI